jgi:hypothetical protein
MDYRGEKLLEEPENELGMLALLNSLVELSIY